MRRRYGRAWCVVCECTRTYLSYGNAELAWQVSTASGTLSRLVHLHIAVPEAFILGADEHHVDAGSAINLVCIIEKVPIYSLRYLL